MADVKSLIANMLATGKRPRWDEMPEGDFLPKEALGSALDAEMSFDGSHPRQQEQEAINAFRGYGPQMLMDAFIPGYGAGGDAKAASEAYGEGRYGAAALNASMAALDFVPVLGALPAAAKGIRAYHGSPHDFDRFDMSKIGTGEGAQAYGHGLYFADSEDVAKSYRQALAPGEDPRQGVMFRGSEAPDKSPETPVEQLIMYMRQPGYTPEDAFRRARETFTPEMLRDIEGLSPSDFSTFKQDKYYGKGRMYEVNINADPEAFLDWDKPLSEQPAKVRDAFASVAPEAAGNPRGDMGYMLNQAANEIASRDGSWAQAANKANVTPALRDAGIPGIKYLDAGSRGAGDGSRNYVVFDDRLITILRKYGIGGLIAGGGAYALTDAEYAQAAELLAQDGMNTGAQ